MFAWTVLRCISLRIRLGLVILVIVHVGIVQVVLQLDAYPA